MNKPYDPLPIADSHPVQSIISRTGSFPLKVALGLLRPHCPPGTIVFDPFAGKGTSLLAARTLGVGAYGCDIAPEAVICSQAKLANVTLEDVRNYISALDATSTTSYDAPAEVRTFFHRSTLAEILAIREQLSCDLVAPDARVTSLAAFTMACLLGILHGHASYSLSVASAHAYSMSPAYVERYAAENGLVKPVRDVKNCLKKKAAKCLSRPLPQLVPGAVRIGCAMECASLFQELVGKVDVILTSPPYLNAQTYAKDNWLRLWLLGHDYRRLRASYIETGSIALYSAYMEAALEQMVTLLRTGGHLICVAGDVRLPKRKIDTERRVFKTGEFLSEMCSSTLDGLSVEFQPEQNVISNTRYYHALNKTNGHSSDDIRESVFIAIKR